MDATNKDVPQVNMTKVYSASFTGGKFVIDGTGSEYVGCYFENSTFNISEQAAPMMFRGCFFNRCRFVPDESGAAMTRVFSGCHMEDCDFPPQRLHFDYAEQDGFAAAPNMGSTLPVHTPRFGAPALAATPSQPAAVSAPSNFPLMRSAICGLRCEGRGDAGRYTMEFRFKSIAELHRANDEWQAARAAAPVSGPTDSNAAKLMQRLESVYQFECEGGALRNCREWMDLRGCIAVIAGCFEAAEVEGLQDAVAAKDGERLADLVERRLMHAYHAVQDGALAAPVSGQGASIDTPEFQALLPADMTQWKRQEICQFIDSRPRSEDSQKEAFRQALEIIAVGDATSPKACAEEVLIATGFWNAALASTPPKADNE